MADAEHRKSRKNNAVSDHVRPVHSVWSLRNDCQSFSFMLLYPCPLNEAEKVVKSGVTPRTPESRFLFESSTSRAGSELQNYFGI